MRKRFKTLLAAKMYLRYRKALLWFKSLFVDVGLSLVYIECLYKVHLENGSHTEYWVNESFITKAQEAEMTNLMSEYMREEIERISGSTSV